ncbi:hypothetical protein Hanom_Chr03g00250521 [Helianthus anomalus]
MCIGATAARTLKIVGKGELDESPTQHGSYCCCVLLFPATLYMEENVVGITRALARQDFGIVWLLLFKYANHMFRRETKPEYKQP